MPNLRFVALETPLVETLWAGGADTCERYTPDGDALPVVLDSSDFIVRGYGHDDRIAYGTGKVTPTDEISTWSRTMLARDEIAYLHVRWARNNCYQCRIERF